MAKRKGALELVRGDASDVPSRRNRINFFELAYQRIEELELETRHDVIAFLIHIEQLAGDSARWLHHGLTSSDIADTSLASVETGT